MSKIIATRIELTDEEKERIDRDLRVAAGRTVIGAITLPFHTAKTLIQLGFEPFELTTGKTFIYFGRTGYFLPNVLSYARSLYKERGLAPLYNGLDAFVVANLTLELVSTSSSIYLDRYFPEVGGKAVGAEKKEFELTDHQSFQRFLRGAIRESITTTTAVVITRPLFVVLVRKIAQLVGRETKYGNVFSALKTVGNEEGPFGLFSGLAPAVIGNLIVVWGTHSLLFAVERGLQKAEIDKDADKDPKVKENAEATRNTLRYIVPFIVNTVVYPYNLVSTVMAVSGSGLAVSLLPFSPTFGSYADAWRYLTPAGGLKRGSRVFLREHVGAVTVGPDQHLYASTKHLA